jgi:hypothetical protein
MHIFKYYQHVGRRGVIGVVNNTNFQYNATGSRVCHWLAPLAHSAPAPYTSTHHEDGLALV